MLIQTGRFNEALFSPTTIGVCAFIPKTDHLRGDPLKKYLADEEIKLPPIEHLVAACILPHSVTGRHLVLPGRVTRALYGAVELKGSHLHVHFDGFENFDKNPRLVVSGTVKSGLHSPVVGSFDKLMGQVKAMFQIG